MSTYSSNLYIELIGTGEQTGTWGSTTNNNFQYVFEEAIVGRATVAFSDADVTLTPVAATTNQTFRNVYLNCTGTNTASRNLIVPTINKNYIVENNTTGGFNIVVKTSAGTGITIPNGYKCAVYVDGTNVVTAFNYLGSALTLSSLVVNGTSSLLSTTGVGTAATTDVMLRIGGTPAVGGGSTYGFLSNPTYSGTITNLYNIANSTALAAGATVTNSYGFLATVGTWGAGATVTNQYGFLAPSTLTGATNNYGFASDIAAGTNRWNFYAGGTASNYFAGSTIIGASSSYSLTLNAYVASNINFAADNTYNIGASSTTYRPANVYVAAQVNVGNTLNGSGYGILSGAQLSATTSFSSYTADGLYGATALPSRFVTPGNSYLLFGYADAGGGQYWPRMGFQNGSGCAVQAKNSIGNDNSGNFWIGTGTGNTEALRILASDQSVHVGSTYITTGLSGNYLTAQSIGLGNQSGDSSYLRRTASGVYQWQTTISGTSNGTVELQPYAGYVGIGTGGSGAAYLLDMYYADNAVAYAQRISSSTDYNGILMGAATAYGSNNSAQNKWTMRWRGRATGSGHSFALHDEINNQDVLKITPASGGGTSEWFLQADAANGIYLIQNQSGSLGVCTPVGTTPTNPYPGFYFQGGGMVSPQVYDMAVHKNILYSGGWKYTVSSKRGAVMFVQDGYFTWSGTAGGGTAGGTASVLDYMALDVNKNLAIGSSTNSTGGGSGSVARLYVGGGWSNGNTKNDIAHDQHSYSTGLSRTVYFNQGQSGAFSKIRVEINLQGAGGWCLELNSGGTGGGGYLVAGGYMNGPANYSFTSHASSGTWANGSVSANIFYVELQSNVGTHPVIWGSITGSLNQDFGSGDITVTFS